MSPMSPPPRGACDGPPRTPPCSPSSPTPSSPSSASTQRAPLTPNPAPAAPSPPARSSRPRRARRFTPTRHTYWQSPALGPTSTCTTRARGCARRFRRSGARTRCRSGAWTTTRARRVPRWRRAATTAPSRRGTREPRRNRRGTRRRMTDTTTVTRTGRGAWRTTRSTPTVSSRRAAGTASFGCGGRTAAFREEARRRGSTEGSTGRVRLVRRGCARRRRFAGATRTRCTKRLGAAGTTRGRWRRCPTTGGWCSIRCRGRRSTGSCSE
mmetsp:Transcript_4057/g.16564  ORF Transcript_4057/g.16564 Transcript_4057/m.16564 type:complete len:268 (+) Transcript_4057:402-1205(+)